MPHTFTPPPGGAYTPNYRHPDDTTDPAVVESFNYPMRQLGNMQQFHLEHVEQPLANLALARIQDTVDGKTVHRHIYDAGTLNELHDVCWGAGAGLNTGGLYLAVGHGEPQGTGNAGLLLYSPDGRHFTPTVHAHTAHFYGVAHGGAGAYGSRRFLVVGGSTDGARIYANNDGESPLTQQGAAVPFVESWRGVAWNGNVWCVVGTGGRIATLDDDDLTALTSRPAAESYTGTWRRVYAHGSVLLAFGDDGEIQRSTNNGETWARVHSDAALGSLTQALYTAAGLLVGTSKANTYLLSTDGGLTWTERTVVPAGGTATIGAVASLVKYSAAGQAVAAIVETSQGNLPMLSFDGGLTWPAITSFGGRRIAWTWRASASDGVGAVLVGRGVDPFLPLGAEPLGETVAAILATPPRAAFHGL